MIKDVADLFAVKGEGAKEIVERLKGVAKDALDLALDEAPAGSMRQRYLYVRQQIFPLLLRIEDEVERHAALDDVGKTMGLKIRDLRKALVEEEEKSKPKREEKEEPDSLAPEPGTERHDQAVGLLRCPDILQKAAEDMERLGHVGEANTKKLALVCGSSAMAGRPIQPSTHAQSSSGKNFLWDMVLSLLPPEKIVKRSGVSAKALFRTQSDLRGAVLYLQEVVGSEDADFSIRVLQSDGRLVYEATEKLPDGSIGTVVHEKEGPCVVVQTTTKNHLHPENETRVFPIYLDESHEQTGRIVDSLLQEAAGGGVDPAEKQEILGSWRDAVRLLEPLEVVVPYARRIRMPKNQIRIRRDAGRVLDVVRVIAWLHQHQREKDTQGRILASEEDFHAALRLVNDSLVRAWRTLTPAEEKVMEAIQELPVEKRDGGFRRRDLKVPGVSHRRVNEILSSLAGTGYLDSDGRKGPQGYAYTLAREAETTNLGISLLPPPDGHENAATEPNLDERRTPAHDRQAHEDSHTVTADLNASGDERDRSRRAEEADLQAERVDERAGEPAVDGAEASTEADDHRSGSEQENHGGGAAVLKPHGSVTPTATVNTRQSEEGPNPDGDQETDSRAVEILRRYFNEHPEDLKADANELIADGFFDELDLFPTAEEVEEVQWQGFNDKEQL